MFHSKRRSYDVYGKTNRGNDVLQRRSRILVFVATLLVAVSVEAADSSLQPASDCTNAVPHDLRIIASSPSIIAILRALGAGDKIVAVNTASAFLFHRDTVTVIDPRSDRAIDDVWRQQPGLFLTETQIWPVGLIQQLRAKNLTVGVLEPRSLFEAFDAYRDIASLIGCESQGVLLVHNTSRELARLSASVLGKTRPNVAVILGRNPIRVATEQSIATHIAEIAGGNTVFGGWSDAAEPVAIQSLAERRPDVILDASESEWTDDARQRAVAFWARLPVIPRVIFIPREMTGNWANLAASVRTIMSQYYPERDPQTEP